jgi:hypothetical protein
VEGIVESYRFFVWSLFESLCFLGRCYRGGIRDYLDPEPVLGAWFRSLSYCFFWLCFLFESYSVSSVVVTGVGYGITWIQNLFSAYGFGVCLGVWGSRRVVLCFLDRCYGGGIRRKVHIPSWKSWSSEGFLRNLSLDGLALCRSAPGRELASHRWWHQQVATLVQVAVILGVCKRCSVTDHTGFSCSCARYSRL